MYFCFHPPAGGLDEGLREVSLKDLIERNLPGYAIGGLAGKYGCSLQSIFRCKLAWEGNLPGWASIIPATPSPVYSSGGEEKLEFIKVVNQCAPALPPGKPRYVMGIGYPLDVVLCSALGADMYDSVYPTRTARFGVALVDTGTMKVKNSEYKHDMRYGAAAVRVAPLAT